MIALIPARGGSKGLPGKNIKELLGKPLIAYTIEAARRSTRVTRVIVSTDCKEIAKIALEYGAEVPFMRPAELSTDTSKAINVYIHFFHAINEGSVESLCVDECVVLLPTCPLRTSKDIDSAIDLFVERKADSVISYTEEAHPLRWHKYLDGSGQFINIFPETIENRQEERVSYYPNGAIYVFKKILLERGSYYSDRSYAYLMPRNRSVDVDTIDDFNYVEYLMG